MQQKKSTSQLLKSSFFFFLSLLFLALLPQKAFTLELGRSLPVTVRDLEFFYKHRQAQSVPGMLRALDQNKCFQKGELRLFTAAFLAEFLREFPKEKEKIFTEVSQLSPYAQRMWLWTCHFCQDPRLKDKAKGLPCARDEQLKRKLRQCPSSLKDWDLLQSASVLGMYWGAFFASGKTSYLDPIINAALLHGRLRSRGLQNDPRNPGAQRAAASLYELCPRHPVVREHLSKLRPKFSGAEAKTLDLILRSTP
ncbi:MAG: translation initiation factor 2 [Desulfovibrio sp.]|nr:translation initiation factor 2 [Desulfovibrio sp.]